MSKAIRASRLYMENNPVYQQAMARVQGSFTPLWDEFSELQIEVTENALICERQPVLQEENKTESLAFTLFKDGLRTLTLAPGVEDNELVKFLQIVNKAKALDAEAQDDLITLLWEEEFEHFKYHYVELGQADAPAMDAGAGDPIGGGMSSDELASQIREDASQAEEARQSAGEQASAADLDIRPYFLDRDEIQYLRDEVVREYQQDLRSNVMAMVFDIMEMQKDEAIREETMVIIEDFLPHILADGDLGTVGYVLEQIPLVLERHPKMAEYLQERLANIPAKLSDPASVRDLIVYLDSADPPPDSDSLKQFLDELRPEALEAILLVLPSLKNIRLSSALGETIGRLARGNPQQLEIILQSEDRGVLIQVLKLVAELKIGAAVAAVGNKLNSDDVDIRKAAVTALSAVESAGSMMELSKALDDKERSVRIDAAKAFARTGNVNGRSKIESAVAGKSLRQSGSCREEGLLRGVWSNRWRIWYPEASPAPAGRRVHEQGGP